MTSRQKQKREWQRQFILERAVAEFAQHGYRGTTMERIAEVAEVSKGTLYNYFSNKRELFLTIIEWGSGRAREIIEEALKNETQSYEERIRALVGHFMEFFETGRDIHRILMTEGNRVTLSGPGDLKMAIQPQYMQLITHLAEFIHQGQEHGAFRQCDPQRAAIMALNMVTAELSYSIFSNYPEPVSTHADEVAEFVLGALSAPAIGGDPAL